MATAIDKVAGPIAVNLIRQFGKRLTLTRITEGAYDPAQSTGTDTTSTQTFYGVVEEYSPKEYASGMVEVGDKKITLAGRGFGAAPALSDKVTVDAKVFAIVRVNTIYSGEDVALYVLQVRI